MLTFHASRGRFLRAAESGWSMQRLGATHREVDSTRRRSTQLPSDEWVTPIRTARGAHCNGRHETRVRTATTVIAPGVSSLAGASGWYRGLRRCFGAARSLLIFWRINLLDARPHAG